MAVTSRKKKRAPVKRKKPVKAKQPRVRALAWFANLSARLFEADTSELQSLIAEARTFDLVGLTKALKNDAQVLALNTAANDLIDAAVQSAGVASAKAFQLQVLRDILNDS